MENSILKELIELQNLVNEEATMKEICNTFLFLFNSY
jgi:hypothetical protein